MWKRIELHNHTIESDGAMKAEELVSYLHEKGIQNFSLTDHNTISGWQYLPKSCNAYHMEYMQGLELTTFYGHLLAQNIDGYIDWDDIDEKNADPLFKRIHEHGGVAGPAHPFSIPTPFSNGMNWSMQIHDYHLVDFIEVINNAHSMNPDNKRAIEWWEKLVLDGYRIAPLSGMDLHRKENMDGFYTTYMDVKDNNLSLGQQFKKAVQKCKTQVTRGILIDTTYHAHTLQITLNNIDASHTYHVQCTTSHNSTTYLYHNPIQYITDDSLVIIKVYKDDMTIDCLEAITMYTKK